MTHSLFNQHNLFRSQESQVIKPLPPERAPQLDPSMNSGNPVPQPMIRLTLRDLNLFKVLSHVRYLTANQAEALFWRAIRGGELGTQRSAQRRLQQLRQAGLIRAIQQRILKGEGDLPYIYALDRDGAVIVSQECGVELRTLDYQPKSGEENYIFMQHLLASNDFWVAITVSSEQAECTLVQWLHEKELRSKERMDYVSVAKTNGKTARVSVIPDSFFILETGRGRGSFPVEIDCSTVPLSTWEQKIRAYLAYHASGAFQKRYGVSNFRLLTVTKSMERLLHMKQCTEGVVKDDPRFWFTTFDQVMTRIPVVINQGTPKQKLNYRTVYNPELLTAPVWYRTGSDQLHSIIE
jgi:hypothetical protein